MHRNRSAIVKTFALIICSLLLAVQRVDLGESYKKLVRHLDISRLKQLYLKLKTSITYDEFPLNANWEMVFRYGR